MTSEPQKQLEGHELAMQRIKLILLVDQLQREVNMLSGQLILACRRLEKKTGQKTFNVKTN